MENYELANVWYRWLANTIDLIIIAFLILIIGKFTMQLGVTNEALAVYPVLFLYFYIVSRIYPSQTVGKKILGIATVDSQTLSPPKFWQVIVRNLFKFFGFFDAVFIFRQNRQRLGDLVAKTIVIKK